MTKESKALCKAVQMNASLHAIKVTKRSKTTASFKGWDAKVSTKSRIGVNAIGTYPSFWL
jgi:hypothetical protein